jgi:ketosteroid isomerase-like protein
MADGRVHEHWETAAEGMTRAMDSADRAMADAVYAESLVVWHNFDQREIDRDAMIASLDGLKRSTPDLHVEVLHRFGTEQGFVQQQVFRGHAPGGELALHSCIVVTLDGDGRIVRLDEYLDTAQSKALRPPAA